MTSFRLVLILLVVLTQMGCAGAQGTIKLYEGGDLDRDHIVTLLPPVNISMVLYVSGRTAGGSCLTSCGFVSPVQVAPGRHRFRSSNMHIARSDIVKNREPVPLESQEVFAVNEVDSSLLGSGFEFDFEQSLEKGRTYALSFGYEVKEGGGTDYFIWWKDVSPSIEQ